MISRDCGGNNRAFTVQRTSLRSVAGRHFPHGLRADFRRLRWATRTGVPLESAPADHLGAIIPVSALRHRMARFGAPPARLGALLHFSVVVHLFARFCARITDLGAGPACFLVQRRTPNHEASRNRANIHAVKKQSDVCRFCVCPAFCQAMLDHLQAHLAALRTSVDTRFHPILIVLRMFHVTDLEKKETKHGITGRPSRRSCGDSTGAVKAAYPVRRLEVPHCDKGGWILARRATCGARKLGHSSGSVMGSIRIGYVGFMR